MLTDNNQTTAIYSKLSALIMFTLSSHLHRIVYNRTNTLTVSASNGLTFTPIKGKGRT